VLELPAVTALLSICRGPVSLESAMRQGADLLADTAEQALRLALIQIRHS